MDALVDTGATFTTIPAAILSELGVQASRRVRLRLAERLNEQDLGRVLVELDGVEEVTFVAFGTNGAPPTIGAVTLETLLLGVDPIAQRLVPVDGWQL